MSTNFYIGNEFKTASIFATRFSIGNGKMQMVISKDISPKSKIFISGGGQIQQDQFNRICAQCANVVRDDNYFLRVF